MPDCEEEPDCGGRGINIVVFTSSWVYFPWPLRRQAAYNEQPGGPSALSPFRGLGNEEVPCPRTLLPYQQMRTGTSRLRVRGHIHLATDENIFSTIISSKCFDIFFFCQL